MATLTITASTVTYLKYLGGTGVSYATVHDAAEATSNGTEGVVANEIGQNYLSGSDRYRIYRYGLEFDCSALSADATVSAAKVQLYAHTDNSTTDFDVTLVSGTDLAFPSVAADYGDLEDDTTSYGIWNTADWPGSASFIDVDLNATGLAAITKAGTTKFGVRSSRDINEDTPTGLEYGYFGGSANTAKFVITYTGLPTVTTQACTNTIAELSTGHGNITDKGNTAVTQHGHCWNTSTDPTTSNSKTQNGAKPNLGQFQSAITGLTPGTTYYVRAYATNTVGTAYGSNVTIATGSTIGRRHFWSEAEDLHWFGESGTELLVKGTPTTSDHGGIMDWM